MSRQSDKERPWSDIIGGGLAQLQHGVDKVADWSFRKIRMVGQKEVQEKKGDNKYYVTAKKSLRGTLRFLGKTGEAFYEKYEELKAAEKKK